MLQDVRFAFRSLVQHRGVTLVAIVCLALGIGVNATMFSIVDGVLIQPFPYSDPERIVILNETNPRTGLNRAGVAYPNLRDWREHNRVFTSVAGVQLRSLTIADEQEPDRYAGAAVSWELFSLLGTAPALGRDFRPEDDRFGAEPVVLLADALWRTRYHADPSIIGRSILVNARPHTIVGIMPRGFEFPQIQKVWVPLGPLAEQGARGERTLWMGFARLRSDVTLPAAQKELAAVATQLAAAYPDTNEGWGVLIRSLRDEWIPDDVRLVLLAMMGAVTLVLLIAAANVANLLLARAADRQREMSIRAAIGAGQWHIVRQLLTESVLLALLSAPLGIGVARLGVVLVERGVPPGQVPYYIHWAIDWRVVFYTVGVAVLTGILFGMVPAAQAARMNLQESLKEGRGVAGGRRARLRHALVIAEVALALIVLIGGALFVRSFMNLQKAGVGFDTAPLMTMRFYMGGDGYAPPEAKTRRVEDVLRRIESLPGVEAAFASNLVPLGGGGVGGRAIVEGHPVQKGQEPGIVFTGVTAQIFQTLGVPLLQGRAMTDREGVTREPVAVINQTMAREVWPNENPIGRRFRLADPKSAEWFTVIGLVADFRHDDLDDRDPQLPTVYVPYPYSEWPNTGLTIRVAGDPAQITGPARRQIRESDPGIALFAVQTMEQLRQLGFWQYRLFGWMFATFGFVALLLSGVGVYGVLSYAVSQRTQEIGVRVALGAARSDVIKMVVGHGLKLTLAGIGIGLFGAVAVTRVVESLLYNVTPTDPISFLGVGAFLTLVASLASYLPARRATSVDPLVALRTE